MSARYGGTIEESLGGGTGTATADVAVGADFSVKQPMHLVDTAVITTTVLQPKTTAPAATAAKHLTTFKGTNNRNKANNNNNDNSLKKNNNNNNNNSKKLPIARDSLESINSRYSISSANDDSQHQQLTTSGSKSPSPTNERILAKTDPPQENAKHSICTTRILQNDSLHVSPPALPTAADWQPWASDDPKTNEDKPQQHLVSMISLGATLTDGKQRLNGNEKLPSGTSDGQEEDEGDPNGPTTTVIVKRSSPDPKPPFKFAGIFASLLASVFFSLSFLCIKLLPNDSYQGRVQALLFRGLYITAICSVAIFIRKDGFLVKRNEIWVNGLRAIFGSVGVFGTLCALKYISLGDSTALIFCSPLWTSILSRIILKEPLHCFHMIALPLSFFGIILIAHPALIVSDEHLSILQRPTTSIMPPINVTSVPELFLNSTHAALARTRQAEPATDVELLISDDSMETSDERWIGVVISLCTSLVVSGTYIVLKFRKSTPIQTTTFWLGIALLITSFILMAFIGCGELPTNEELVLYFFNGTLSWLGQSVLQWAFLHEKAGVLSIVRTMDVAMTFVLSALFLDDDIYWTSLLGASIISLVVVAIMFNNWMVDLACMSRFRGSAEDAESQQESSRHQRKKEKSTSGSQETSYSIGSESTIDSTNTTSKRQIYRQVKA